MSLEMALMLLPGLVVGLTVHEFAHAWSASLLGDGFSRRQGRVSLNPLRHLSPLGTLAIFFLPFGWGRPVMVNLYNFKHPRRDYLLTSLAGPAANLVMAAVCLGLMLLTRHTYRFPSPYDGWMELAHIVLQFVALINVLLATFNLLPIPPLDGSKIWPCVIPGLKPSGQRKTTWIFLVVLIVLLQTDSLQPVIRFAVGGASRLMPVSDGQRFAHHRDAASEAMEAGRWEEAERQATAALAINPRSHQWLMSRAAVRMKLARWDEALEDVDRALEWHAEPDYYDYRAAILTEMGRFDEARAAAAPARAMEQPQEDEGH